MDDLVRKEVVEHVFIGDIELTVEEAYKVLHDLVKVLGLPWKTASIADCGNRYAHKPHSWDERQQLYWCDGQTQDRT